MNSMTTTTTVARRRRRRPSALFACYWLLVLGSSTLVRTTTAISGGDDSFGYVATTDVGPFLKLANDVKEMRTAATLKQKKHVYEKGLNQSTYTLQGLSLDAADNWQATVPLYNLYVAAFEALGVQKEGDETGLFDGQPVETYANTLVNDLFLLNITGIEATGAVALNVLMTYWGELWSMLEHCHANNQVSASAALDAAVALWVGAGQVRHDNQKGHLLYNMAQAAGRYFNQNAPEAEVNAQVLETVLSLQTELKAGQCAEPDYYKTARNKVQLLVQMSNVVLVQMLLHHIQDAVDNGSGSDSVELFALALYPQIAACDTHVADAFMQVTVAADISSVSRTKAIGLLQASFACLGITCDDVGAYETNLIAACQDGPAAVNTNLTSYQPVMDVRELSYLDRDIRQINILFAQGSAAAALDYYRYGWNNADDVSLQMVASNALPWTGSDDYKVFDEYYQATEDSTDPLVVHYGFGDELITNALQGSGSLADASVNLRMAVVKGALESMVPYLGVLGQLTSSFNACDQDMADKDREHWDSAAALLIGSLEGHDERGAGQSGGQSLFAVSKELCVAFGTCETLGSSVTNAELLGAWKGGAAAITEGECEEVEKIVLERIVFHLLVPVIQGFLYYMVESAVTPNNDSHRGHLIAYTQTLLPYMQGKATVASVAAVHANIKPEAVVDVAAGFAALKDGMTHWLGLDCTEVGKIMVHKVLTGVCPDDALPPLVAAAPSSGAATPTPAPTFASVVVPGITPAPAAAAAGDLSWGRYTFVNENIAENAALFTLGVRDMWFSDTPSDALVIYKSPSEYSTGIPGVAEVKSLQDFSTKASLFMSGDPMYNFYRIALFDDASFDGNTTGTSSNGWPYADAVEQLAIGPNNGNSAQLGAQTIIVMEIWMMIVNRLYEAVRICDDDMDAPELIDLAVGLWIGKGQIEGAYGSGWSMYKVAQEAQELYGLPVGEAKINSNLMYEFEEAQAIAKSCSTEKASAGFLRAQVDEIVRSLSIPLLQHLLFHMSDNNFEYVELYALAFIPQVISVDEGAFKFLRDALFEGFNWSTTITTEFLTTFGVVLRALRISCEDLGDVADASENLKGLVAALCVPADTTLLAAYETSYDMTEISRIDLDILQIDLFLRANARELALDVYERGRNSKENTGWLTLKSIATNELRKAAGDLFTLHETFYSSDTYADENIVEAITGSEFGRYGKASRRQRSEAVRTTLQTMVMTMEIVAHLRTAISECRSTASLGSTTVDTPAAGQEHVDLAVVMYVGSIEGTFSGGSAYNSGQMMYALGKDMCEHFDTCESHGDANANVELLFTFSSMKENLDDLNCDAAEIFLEEQNGILSTLPVPVIQGILYYSDVNEGMTGQENVKTGTLAVADILTETLLPEISAFNATTAAFIFDNTDFEFDIPAVRDSKEALFDAFSDVVRGMGIDCADIGTFRTGSESLSVCATQGTTDDGTLTIAPPPNTPTSLGDNLYVSTTYVQDRANIALDIKEMEELLPLGKDTSARDVYKEGRNSAVYDAEGKEIDLRSIASFSTMAAITMRNNPLFHVSVFALQDNSGNYEGQRASKYADTIVQEMFEAGKASKEPLAAEAAVALNLWMELANELFQTVENCKNKVLTDDDGIHSIDEAVAYWIGDGQIAGDADNGHLLYALAEQMGHHFSINSSGQSRTNVNILRLFHQAKMEMSLSNACAEPSTARQVRHIVNKIVSLMVVVNVQSLIHYLQLDDERDRVRIYAHAFVPLVAGCSPDTFRYLKEKLLDAPYKEVDVQDIIAAIRSTFPCLGITCDDVGVHYTESEGVCVEPSRLSALADYRPANDVRQFAMLDLDILELDILLKMEAYTAADELYSYGKHSSTAASNDGAALSLEYLATTSGRSVVPQFDTFRRHFDDDEKYADTLIRKSLASGASSPFGKIQNRAVVVAASQYMIMYMASLQAMHDAVNACVASGSERGSTAAKDWDKAAALLIGHLEGTRVGGSSEGGLLWALSKKYCAEFGTCSEEETYSTKTNDKIATLLFSGRGAILGGSCDELRKATNEIAPLLLVPLLQASLSSSIPLSQRSHKDKEFIQGRAYVFTQTLLPLITDVNQGAAKTIRDNFPLEGVAMRDGVPAVAHAFASVISGLGVDCYDVGSNDEIDACSGQVKFAKSQKIGLSVGIILSTFTIVAIAVLLRSRRKNVLPENSPSFVPSKGEFNHGSSLDDVASDLLNRTADSSPLGSGDEGDFLDASEAMDDDKADDDEYIKAIERALVGGTSFDEKEDDERPEVV